jgi:hypothetical protein
MSCIPSVTCDGEQLAENRQQTSTKPGGYLITFPLTVPNGAEEGEYTLKTRVEALDMVDEREQTFRVTYARNNDGTMHFAMVKVE